MITLQERTEELNRSQIQSLRTALLDELIAAQRCIFRNAKDREAARQQYEQLDCVSLLSAHRAWTI